MLEVRFQKPMKRNSKDPFIQKTLWQMSSTLGPLGGPLQVSNLKQPRAHCKTLLGLKGPCASHPSQGQMAWPHGLPWMGCSDIGTWGWNLDNYSKWLLIKQIWTWYIFYQWFNWNMIPIPNLFLHCKLLWWRWLDFTNNCSMNPDLSICP